MKIVLNWVCKQISPNELKNLDGGKENMSGLQKNKAVKKN
jgi:hypothetical protein